GYGLPSKDSNFDLSVFDAKPSEVDDEEVDVSDETDRLFAERGIGVSDPSDPKPIDHMPEHPRVVHEGGIVDVDDDEVEMIDVIDPKTGKTIQIPKDSASYYSASGVKARRYKGSSKPDSIPSDLWRDASKAERERAKKRDLLEKAAKEHEEAKARSEKLDKRVERLESRSKPKPPSPSVDAEGELPP
ncbi:MAG: hypothetical protein OIF58_11550, partial [Cohaesibacter sp.]|nr:hypothetical protein [Cohaesibacter sp.]